MAVAVQPAMEAPPMKKPSMKQRRVVVTGMGVETPLGHDPDVFYANLLEGASGITEIEAFDCSHYPTVCPFEFFFSETFLHLYFRAWNLILRLQIQRIAGEIKSFSTDGYVAPKLSKRMDKFMLYMLTAGKKALVDGGVTEDVMNELDKTRCGVLIGSALGGMKVTSCLPVTRCSAGGFWFVHPDYTTFFVHFRCSYGFRLSKHSTEVVHDTLFFFFFKKFFL